MIRHDGFSCIFCSAVQELAVHQTPWRGLTTPLPGPLQGMHSADAGLSCSHVINMPRAAHHEPQSLGHRNCITPTTWYSRTHFGPVHSFPKQRGNFSFKTKFKIYTIVPNYFLVAHNCAIASKLVRASEWFSAGPKRDINHQKIKKKNWTEQLQSTR